MFEDATFESTGSIHTRSRSWMLATLTLNSAILLTLILLPLLYPSSLSPTHTLISPIFTPPRPPAAIAHPAARALAQSTPTLPIITIPTTIPAQLSRLGGIHTNTSDTPSDCNNCTGDTLSNGIPGGDPMSTTLPAATEPRVVAKPKGRLTISIGVAGGMLISQPPPIYPAIARAAHIEGTVVLQATISKTGTIEGLHVLSGSPMLRQAAIDAVRQWRYRPYLLNGNPIEVETTINVIFSLGQ